MNIFPAIDLIDGKAVRLFKGDYDQKTVYSDSPLDVAKSFEKAGAEFLHIVDLDGAKEGTSPNFEVIKEIIKNTSLKVEVGGGIRTEEIIKKYIDIGVMRVILGTVAVKNPEFAKNMIKKYGDKIAVGIDILNGYVAIHGWTEVSKVTCDEIFKEFQDYGVKTVICTDISKDGAMQGTNLELYSHLKQSFSMDIVASGGVSDIENIKALAKIGVYGAIVGKALYVGSVDLKEALEVAK